MPYQENEALGAIDDSSSALSSMRESVLIIAARHLGRGTLFREDWNELQRILDACDRLQAYDLIIRATESAREIEAKR